MTVYLHKSAQAACSLYMKYCLDGGKSWLSCVANVLMIPLLPTEVSYSDSNLASGQFINRSGQWTLPAKTKLLELCGLSTFQSVHALLNHNEMPSWLPWGEATKYQPMIMDQTSLLV